jgi:hypothetical protein
MQPILFLRKRIDKNMAYPELTEELEKNFPVILEAYKASYDEEQNSRTAEAYAIRYLSGAIVVSNNMGRIDWEKAKRKISHKKIEKVKAYYNAKFELKEKIKSFTETQQKRLEALLGEQEAEINAFENIVDLH